MSTRPSTWPNRPDTAPIGEPSATRRPPATRYFFVALATIDMLVAIGGFVPEMAGPVELAHPLLAYAHGALMSAWLLLFVWQTGLAAQGSMRWHRALGLASTGLAPLLWVSMGIVSVAQLERFGSYDILLPQVLVMVLFALFFCWGIQARRNAGAHRRLMTLATLVLLHPAIDRLFWLPGFDLPDYWSHAVWIYVLLVPLVVFDAVSIKRVHPVTLTGLGLLVAMHTVISLYWTSPGWSNFASTVTGPWRR